MNGTTGCGWKHCPLPPPKARFDPADTANDPPDRALFAAPQELALATDLPLLALHTSRTTTGNHRQRAAATLEPRQSATNRVVARSVGRNGKPCPSPERASLRTTAAHFFALPAQQQHTLRQRHATQF